MFTPDKESREVSHTVSLRQLPRTTTEVMLGKDKEFSGPSLLSVDSDQTAITEVIHKPNDIYWKTKRVYVNRPSQGAEADEIQRDCVLFKGGSKVQFVADECERVRGDADTLDELEERGQELLNEPLNYPDGPAPEYDKRTEERLKHLGYLSE
jgi:hypothetical protein